MEEQAIELPPLPERYLVMPKLVLPEVHGMGGNTTVLKQEDVFDADQMRAYARQAVLAERERCAKVCEAKSKGWIALAPSLNWEFRAHGAEECAEAIRAG